MRPLLITAVAAAALMTGVAVAQTPPPPPPGGPGAGPAGGPEGGPPPGMHGPGGFERGGFEGGYGRGHGFMHRPPPPKAAFFRFRKGDASVTVKCADDEPTKACTDAVQAMMGAINGATPAR